MKPVVFVLQMDYKKSNYSKSFTLSIAKAASFSVGHVFNKLLPIFAADISVIRRCVLLTKALASCRRTRLDWRKIGLAKMGNPLLNIGSIPLNKNNSIIPVRCV